MPPASYLVALGSNRRGRAGAPAAVLRQALACLPGLVAAAPIRQSAPIGPARRRFANTAALLSLAADPPALLRRLKAIEATFGRRRGRRWGDRVLDLDIIGWSGGTWASPGLVVPHQSFRERAFVLDPLAALTPGWRDPVSGLTVRQLRYRLRRRG